MGIGVVASLAFFTFLLVTVSALRCKCTQSSNKAPCQDGICDVDKGACLMLEHPSSGRLYACSTSPLVDGSCNEKTTKSGVAVKYCSCTGKDFCNYEKWPDSAGAEYDDEVDHPNRRHQTNSATMPFLFASILFSAFLSLTFVHLSI